jgi:hypothetical protein
VSISTVSADQHQILRDIIQLYCPDGFDLDPTYGHGRFYQHGVPEPRYAFDRCPRDTGIQAADCRALPFDDEEVASIIFDPPFLHAPGKASVMGRRFGGYPSQAALHALYREAAQEFHRVLRPEGILVWKCQDVIESGKQVWTHCIIREVVEALGFQALDLFILLKRAAIRGHNWGHQQHAWRGHSYFWVFKKGNRRVDEARPRSL